jgi:hypothetical protein
MGAVRSPLESLAPMRKTIDQDTLQVLIETGSAHEFRVTHSPDGDS